MIKTTRRMSETRIEYMARQTQPKTYLNDPHYIKNILLFRDLKYAIAKYARKNVLDIGCGNKPYMIYFDGLIDTYVGCDIVQSDKRLVDIICPATTIPLGDNTKETVFSTQVLEHVADHWSMVREAYRILKPSGHFILSAPMTEEHHEEPHDFFRFTKHGFKYLLEETGFEVLEIIPNGGKWAVVGQGLQLALRTSLYNKKGFFRRVLKGIYFVLRLRWLINLFFSWLDKADYDPNPTLNFVVIARKN